MGSILQSEVKWNEDMDKYIDLAVLTYLSMGVMVVISKVKLQTHVTNFL